VARFRELAQQCLIKEFEKILGGTNSTRLNAPTISQCAEHLANVASGRRGIDPTPIRTQLEAISATASKELSAKLEDVQSRLPGMPLEELRKLPQKLLDYAEQAEHRLLPEARAEFEQKLAALTTQTEEAIYEKTVGPELQGQGAFANLDETRKVALKELCIQGGCHPSLISILKEQAGTGGLNDSLSAAARIFAAKNENRPPELKDIEQLDRMLLPHPELDDAAQALLDREGDEPDYRFASVRNSRDLGIYMEKQFPKALREQLGIKGNEPTTVESLQRLVAQAAQGDGSAARRLQQLDLTLLQALYCARKAEDPQLSFEAFKQELPAPFNTMPLLKEHLDAGIRGRRDLKLLGKTIEGLSEGLGSKKNMLRFLSQVQSADPRWAAGTALNGLYRSLNIKRNADRKGMFQDAVKDTKRTAAQREQADSTALGAVHDLRLAKARLEDAERAIKGDDVRCSMAARLGIDPDEAKPKVTGATLATGILMLDRILHDDSLNEVHIQNLIKCIRFQNCMILDGKAMQGHAVRLGGSDKMGKAFKEAVDILKDPNNLITDEGKIKFNNAKNTILEMMDDDQSYMNGLRERAKAVVFFKNFGSNSPIEDIHHEFANIQDREIQKNIKNLSSVEAGAYETYKQTLTSELVNIIGTGSRQGELIGYAQQDQLVSEQEAQKVLDKAKNAYAKKEQEVLSQVTAMIVCEQFVRGGFSSEGEPDVRPGTPFYADCLKELTNMGIPAATAEVYLQQTLGTMKEGFFATLARQGLQGADTYTEIFRLVDMYMDELNIGNSLTFKKTSGVSVNVPVVEAGAAEVSVHLDVARENGISVWKDSNGQYHMTLMKGASIGVGVEAKVGFDSIINAVEATADVNAQGGVGCDLSFPNQAQCQIFLSAVLGGKSGPELLGLCDQASVVSEVGVGVEASLTVGASISIEEDVDIVSLEASVSAGISGLWTTATNGEDTQRTRTVHGFVSVSAEFSLGTEEMQDDLEELQNTVTDITAEVGSGEDIAETIGSLSLSQEATLRHEYEEQRSVTTDTRNGKLKGSERVRAFAFSDKQEALALLRDAGVPLQTLRDVQEDLKKLPEGQSFRIELASDMREDAVQAYNAQTGAQKQIRGRDFDLREVRLVTEDSVEQSSELELRIVKLHSGRSLNRTHTEAYRASSALQQAA